MKNILFLITLITLTLVSNTATAPVQAQGGYIWTCQASSRVAVGIWQHYNQGFAAQRAMEECQIRTPAHMACYLDGCH